MIKSLSLAMLLTSSSLLAVETQWFIGADASSANIDAKLNYTGTVTINGSSFSNDSSDHSDRDTSLGLKAGVVLDKTHRLSVNYTKFDPTDGSISAELTNATFNYDYLFSPISKVTFFTGAHIGMHKFEVIGFDDTALSYGVQAGILYPLVGNFELEMGASYTKLDAKPTTPTLNGTYSGITFTNASASLEAKDMTTMHVGLNYRF